MNWGKGIIAAFVLFATLIVVMVVVSMKQDVSLVTKSYYQDELDYQQQLDRKNNTELLAEKPEIRIVHNKLEVYFPFASYVEQGTVKLFRPSDARLDQNFTLSPSADSLRVFNVPALEKGAYRVKMNWSMEGREYYIEKLIVI